MMEEKLTIDEIIEHCERQVKRLENLRHEKEYWEHKQVKGYLEELKRYRKMEEDGKLLTLRCKPGDTVYSYCSELDAIFPYFVEQVVVDYDEENGVNFTMVANFHELDELIDCIDFEEKAIGKNVFQTEQEAKEALEVIKND